MTTTQSKSNMLSGEANEVKIEVEQGLGFGSPPFTGGGLHVAMAVLISGSSCDKVRCSARDGLQKRNHSPMSSSEALHIVSTVWLVHLGALRCKQRVGNDLPLASFFIPNRPKHSGIFDL